MTGVEPAPAGGNGPPAMRGIRTASTGVRLALVGGRPAAGASPARGPRAPTAARVLTTVLFVDVVDSTGHARALGDERWLALLERHDAMVRGEIRRAGGRAGVAVGDGLAATFGGAAAAVRCALRIAAHSPALGLQVRCGLHCGEAQRHGARVGGIVFHIAARVMTRAAPGEVLVSETLTQLAAGSMLGFDGRGRRVLRGFPGAWRLYAVTDAPGGRDLRPGV